MRIKLLKYILGVALVLNTINVTVANAAYKYNKQVEPYITNNKNIEVVFVLDSTGSMSGLIQAAKDKIWSVAHGIVRESPETNIKFGLIAYRDIHDAYTTKQYEITDDLDLFYQNLDGIEAQGGGDTPESVNQALREAINDLEWNLSKDTSRIVFLVGDAPPHMDYEQDIPYSVTSTHAVKKQIKINTIQCGNINGTKEIWNEIADLTEGEYLYLPTDGNTQKISTPYDQQIKVINTRLNDTIIIYGSKQTQRDTRSKVAFNSSMPEAVAAERSAFVGASDSLEGSVVTGDGDLVDSIYKKSIKVDDIEEDLLEEEYKNLTKEELKSKIDNKLYERNKLNQELQELNKKRQEYIDKTVKVDENSFESRVSEIIKVQSSE